MIENNPKSAREQQRKPTNSAKLNFGFLTPVFDIFISIVLFIAPIAVISGMGYFLVVKVYKWIALPAGAPFGEKLFEYLIVLLIPCALLWLAVDLILPGIEDLFPKTKPHMQWIKGKGVKLLSTFVKAVILVGAALLLLRYLSNYYGWGLPFDSGN